MLKTLALAFSLSAAAVPTFAQSPAPALASSPPYQYCILVSSGDRYASSDVQLEYGQRAKSPVQDAQLAQDNLAVAKLGSVVAALNYMSLRGWECLSATAITSKSNAYANTTDSQIGYLLRRRVQ